MNEYLSTEIVIHKKDRGFSLTDHINSWARLGWKLFWFERKYRLLSNQYTYSFIFEREITA